MENVWIVIDWLGLFFVDVVLSVLLKVVNKVEKMCWVLFKLFGRVYWVIYNIFFWGYYFLRLRVL